MSEEFFKGDFLGGFHKSRVEWDEIWDWGCNASPKILRGEWCKLRKSEVLGRTSSSSSSCVVVNGNFILNLFVYAKNKGNEFFLL